MQVVLEGLAHSIARQEAAAEIGQGHARGVSEESTRQDLSAEGKKSFAYVLPAMEGQTFRVSVLGHDEARMCKLEQARQSRPCVTVALCILLVPGSLRAHALMQ